MADVWAFAAVTAPTTTSGVVEIGTGDSTLTLNEHRTMALRVWNTLDSEQKVTVKRGDNVVLIAAKPIAAHDSVLLELGFIKRTGLKIHSDIANGVFCEWEGWEGI